MALIAASLGNAQIMLAALVSFLVLMHVIATDGGVLRVALAGVGFAIFLGLAIVSWTRRK